MTHLSDSLSSMLSFSLSLPLSSMLSLSLSFMLSLSLSPSCSLSLVLSSFPLCVASPSAVLVPLEAQIEDLGPGNVYWLPEQLAAMSDDTFVTTADTLGTVTTYSSDQLSVLRLKVIGVLRNTNSCY